MPETIITKTCNIHGELIRENIKTGIYKGKRYIKCRLCELERSRKYHKKKYQDPKWVEEKHIRDKMYWEENKEEIKERRRKPQALSKRRVAYHKNAEKYRQHCRSKQDKYRKELHDSYVKRILVADTKILKFDDITKEMIETKRNMMLLRRKIRELGNSDE